MLGHFERDRQGYEAWVLQIIGARVDCTLPWRINRVVTQDFNMMTLCATMERTQAQWAEMLSMAGIKVVAVHPAPDGVSEGVIEAEVL